MWQDPPEYDPTHKPPPRGIFCAIMLIIATWVVIATVALLLFACSFDPTQRVDGPLYFWVILFAGCIVTLTLTWIGLDWCIYEMREAWKAMEGREWRWPEGNAYGPGKEPHHLKENRK